LGKRATNLIADGSSELFASAASWWELAIKKSLGRLDIDFLATRRELKARGVTMLPVTLEHAEALSGLPQMHSDPFDRMLVAQASAENLILLTRDKSLRAYGSTVLCV
jgi:PIN domain nuclease of toxin-antitoxin system